MKNLTLIIITVFLLFHESKAQFNSAKYDSYEEYKSRNEKIKIYKVKLNNKWGIVDSKGKELIPNEYDRIEEIIGERPKISRQHYLKLNLPQTYRQLIHYGIKEDYTMGYADEVGFRAGTARPFYFFDLPKNHTTNLLIHSFTYMDRTLKDYMNLSKGEVFKLVEELFREVNAYGGEYVCLLVLSKPISSTASTSGEPYWLHFSSIC